MDIKDVLEAIQIEGASSGDVVFISFPPDADRQDFVRFATDLGAHAAKLREGGDYFPRCIVVPPGVTVEVACAQLADKIAVALSPDAGFPHG